ncbi:signal transduction histidine kinase [Kibdelosporangium banguiense]|uniref:histidine kinase n=1 Tax=Kibdelosporangium banguiense TaxID=1365924 RepID=A0ABS4TFE0_9PSEU|nr:sensor histidine kinase [Kibdelosporangium banguiense]MBP2323129.1 signal transduction histidine kinase [Kibdelosporangium banguiense]
MGGRAPTAVRSAAAEVALVLCVGVIGVVGSVLAASRQPDRTPLDGIAYLLLGAAALALALRHRHPAMTLLVTLGAALTYHVLGYPYGPAPLAALIATYTVVSAGGRGDRLLAFGVAGVLAGYPIVELIPEVLTNERSAAAVLVWVLIMLAVVVLGENARVRRRYLAEIERRMLAAEKSREEEAHRRAGEERMRIAREIHDITSHTISVIAIQASVAAESMKDYPDCPEQAYTAMTTIRKASKEALSELRATIGVLRDTGDPSGPRNPPSGLAQLDDLIASTMDAGLPADLMVSGEPRPLPAVVDLTAYRIVQESLTNALRHAQASCVRVGVDYRPDGIELVIEDDGRASPAAGGQAPNRPGFGLLSMAERATAIGGELTTGRRAGAGFRVHAWLPTPTTGDESP